MREKGCAGCSMRGKRLDQFMQTFHEHGKRQQRHERKGQDCSVYSSQYLQIIFTLGIIPVPPWLFMAYKTLYLGSRSVDLLVTGSRSPSYVLGRGRVSICSSSTLPCASIHGPKSSLSRSPSAKPFQPGPGRQQWTPSPQKTLSYPSSTSKSKLSSCSRAPLTVYLSAMLKFFHTYAFLHIGRQ